MESELGKVCDAILANMAILFVLVGVAAMRHSGLFASTWPVIAFAIVVGTLCQQSQPGTTQRLAKFAADLVRINVDVIVTSETSQVL